MPEAVVKSSIENMNDLAFPSIEPFSRSMDRLTAPVQKVEALPVAKAFPPALSRGTSVREAIAMSANIAPVGVNVYRIAGKLDLATEIVIPENYDSLLNPVRSLRIASESHDLGSREDAATKLAEFRLGKPSILADESGGGLE